MISLPTLTWLVPRGSSAPLGTWRWSPQWKWPRPRTAVRIPAFRFISDRHFQMTNLLLALRKLSTILVSSIMDSMHPRWPRALISVWSLIVSHASLRNLKFVNVLKRSTHLRNKSHPTSSPGIAMDLDNLSKDFPSVSSITDLKRSVKVLQ